MKIQCPAFADGEKIPQEYTMNGENVVPPLAIDDVPAKARSLALIVDDPDAPKGTFTHWLLFNLNPKTRDLGEDGIPPGAMQGVNDFGHAEYGGPKPPSGEHRYFFKAYALDSFLDLKNGARRSEIEAAMEGHIVATAALMGKYASDSNS